MTVTIRKPFSKIKRSGLICGLSMTKQSHKDECDINKIVATYNRTGLITHQKENPGIYTECNSVDFLQSQIIVSKAKQMFSELPSKIRDRFNNDPATFMDFMHNPDNKDEIYRLGLAERPEETPKQSPIQVEVVPPAEQVAKVEDAAQTKT
nr:MAG: internal scaffolding protein [Microvirus sp.]